ncbi:response regulator [Thalassolituus sp.]|jgi:CheY-like chemotaxis protein/EAL domain-containing protein (putative c-di-GMP-specific phosphodiesterase class I)|uniref:response regulator n=1 Tax=Thalassolituus sp. TaxID=2030822 RepID=UPI0035182FB3
MQINILLADDEPGILQALKRMLRPTTWTIFEANDGEEALEILQREHIHVLVTDYKMPRRDGISLCQEARRLSPYTYRLLLSGQVDYAALRSAWHAGDVHRFVAKPWDNTLLTMDIEEGLRQQKLLNRTWQFQQNIAANQAVMLTDDNWIIRLANPRLCKALGIEESEALGLNLFSPTLSAMPVTLEAEVTRQVEAGQTWLGHFTLHGQDQSQIPSWMAISPLGKRYRLCVFDLVNGESEKRETRAEHADAESLVSPQPVTLTLEFTEADVADLTRSADIYQALKGLCPGGAELYHLPEPNRFLMSATGIEAIEQLRQWPAENNLINDLRVTSTLEELPDDEDHESWLRNQLGRIQQLPDSIPDDFRTLPVFGLHGGLLALECRSPSEFDEARWHDWFSALITSWQPLFATDLKLVIDASGAGPEITREFLPALRKARESMNIECYVILDEDRLLSDQKDDIMWQGDLVHHGIKRLISHFGRSFLNARQILSLPIDGITLAPEFLARLQDPRNAVQGGRLLQKLHEHGMLIYARDINRSELLAVSHKARIDWISGNVMSPEIGFRQLQWYSPSATLG